MLKIELRARARVFICVTIVMVLIAALAGTAGAEAVDRLLRQGSSGDDVLTVQRLLTTHGIDPGPLDGIFGPMTHSAVTSFQQTHNLTVDGIVGPQTIGALRATSTSRGAQEPRPPVLPLAGKTIVLDPGHGGPAGARGPAGTWEDDNVLAIGKYARDLLENAGATVVLTRQGRDRPYDPYNPSAGQLAARVNIANRSGADIFVSIHNNASTNRAIRGMATYYRTAAGARTAELARTLQHSLVQATGLRDIGLIPANFYVLRNARMTSVLLEIGFISNPTEEQILASDSFHRKAAEGIYQGLLSFYRVSDEGVQPPSRGADTRPDDTRAEGEKPIVFGYWAQWGTETEPMESLQRNITMMDMVSPYWYTALGDGSLRSRESDHSQLHKIVADAGAKLLVMINNDKSTDAMLTNPQSRARLADNIVALVKDGGYDGVNIDFEDLKPHHRSQLTDLVKQVADKLRPQGLLTTVAVGAKWSHDESSNDWAACYDYTALASHADYLVIMAYDQHGTWRGPGPVAGIDWVESIVRYSVSVAPASKLILGVPAYGYDWANGQVHQIVTADQALALANENGVPIIWNDHNQVPMFRYQSGGRTHEVWFENSYSASRKMRLVNRYGLAGMGIWKIGYEDQRFWDVMKTELLN